MGAAFRVDLITSGGRRPDELIPSDGKAIRKEPSKRDLKEESEKGRWRGSGEIVLIGRDFRIKPEEKQKREKGGGGCGRKRGKDTLGFSTVRGQ